MCRRMGCDLEPSYHATGVRKEGKKKKRREGEKELKWFKDRNVRQKSVVMDKS